MPEARRMFATGEVATTASGRLASPFPRVDLSTSGRARNTIKRVRRWLFAEATEEAKHMGNETAALMFGSFIGTQAENAPPAFLDSADDYLFGGADA